MHGQEGSSTFQAKLFVAPFVESTTMVLTLKAICPALTELLYFFEKAFLTTRMIFVFTSSCSTVTTAHTFKPPMLRVFRLLERTLLRRNIKFRNHVLMLLLIYFACCRVQRFYHSFDKATLGSIITDFIASSSTLLLILTLKL